MENLAKQGTLFYLMGASGAGKDSLLGYARQRLNGIDRPVFAHRYITRPPEPRGENHIHLTETDFEQRLHLGFFVMHWQSHGYRYGIGIEIDYWLSQNANVVVNGSRAYLEKSKNPLPKTPAGTDSRVCGTT